MKIAHDNFRLHAVENGWVLTLYEGYQMPLKAEYVFHSADELAEWISCYFHDDAEEIRDAQRAEKRK